MFANRKNAINIYFIFNDLYLEKIFCSNRINLCKIDLYSGARNMSELLKFSNIKRMNFKHKIIFH